MDGKIDWGRIPPEKRGRDGRWLVVRRGARSQDAIRDLMAELGQPISPSYYSEIETGKKPLKEPYASVLVRVHGEDPDNWEDPWERPATPEPNDLLSVLSEIRDELRLFRVASDRNADVLAELLGIVLRGRLPQSESADEDPSPAPLSTPGR